ncbi:MAG: rRNA maturation RNase YbeY [Pelagibacteraceae bacterium TMED216]|nr:MAG: rRNA maturation RNase YbeY [Pelagibacteraceae bacterium TMED216]|tara:strand:+ start:3042 stop:3521 length:480 start_codon:yes stop_codon:yes gene_type:complete
MIKVNVFVKNVYWKKHISDPNKYLNKKIRKLSKSETLIKKKNYSFSVMLTGNKDIKYLNNKFRNKNKTTDVLSFPFHEKKELKILLKKNKNFYLGDIIINFFKIKKNKEKKNFLKEFNILWIHGLLHLLGYSHKVSKEYLKMSKIEKRYLLRIENDRKD